MVDISHIRDFLFCSTPKVWLEYAQNNIPLLLIDHANCELKAAQTAQSIMWKYGLKFDPESTHINPKKSILAQKNSTYRYHDNFQLLNKMSRLAREELRHFEQVIALMKKRGIEYQQIDASNYAGELRKATRTNEPEKLIDTLIVGAIIEARSCERFSLIAPYLDEELQRFYMSLLKSEARHYQDYLRLAKSAAQHFNETDKGDDLAQNYVNNRVNELLQVEKNLILSEVDVFRFHSGPVSQNSL